MENFINVSQETEEKPRPALIKYYEEFKTLKEKTNYFDNDQLNSDKVNEIKQLIEKIRDLFNAIKFKNHAEVSIHKELSLMIMIAENKIQDQ